MAMREDAGLSVVLLVSMPLVVLFLGPLVRMMVPSFQKMQVHIDRLNQVLREQITGIRVVRAFVREPEEDGAIRGGQPGTHRYVPAGRSPHVGDVPDGHVHINAASIAVLWVGAIASAPATCSWARSSPISVISCRS